MKQLGKLHPGKTKTLAARTKMLPTLSLLQIPETVVRAFLIPDGSDEPDMRKNPLTSLFGGHAMTLKLDAFSALRDPRKLSRLKTIVDPLDRRRNLVTLILLEVLLSLNVDGRASWALGTKEQDWSLIADHFGFWQLRYLMEDRIFEIRRPEEYRLLQSLLKQQCRSHRQFMTDIMDILRHHILRSGIKNVTICCRRKNVFGMYLKMRLKRMSFNHITDLFGVRVITESAGDCYRVLIVLQGLWRAFPHNFRDYIAEPKANGYRSIHTTMACLDGRRVEFQIRTRKMDLAANFGPANHATYKVLNRKKAGVCL
jgi:hypothetical protein